MIEKDNLQVDLARKDFYPDFNVQYMWQRTDPTKFRAYCDAYRSACGFQFTAAANNARNWRRSKPS